MFIRTKKRGNHTYLMIAECQRINGKVKQTVLHSLGRLDILQQTGKLDALLSSAERFSQKLMVLGARNTHQALATMVAKIGPALIFERLWQELKIDQVLSSLLKGRKYEFSMERAVFMTVLHRLFISGSDRAAEKWKKDYTINGVDDLELHHLYRAMAWLGEKVEDQDDATPFAPRCVKDRIEELIFSMRKDLFTGLEIVFFDTTSIYFEGNGGQTIGEYGHSKDHRPDLKQMVVAVVLDNDGMPICSQLWPGNTADAKSLIPIANRLQKRFGIKKVCIVADRGMISKETMKQLEELKWDYILGVRMQLVKEVREEVLTRAGRYEEVYPKSADKKAPSPLKVKEVEQNNRRYIVCLNEDQARKDRYDRESIVKSLEDALKRGDKSLVGNKGYRRYLKTAGQRFEIDLEKLKEQERYDGKWVITTNTQISAHDLAIKYKQLWMVEDIFRSMKSLLQTRPIYHKCDETIRGHVFCSFLALILRKELQDRLETKGYNFEWADIINDLDNLIQMQISDKNKSYLIRSEATGTITKVAQVCSATIPPPLQAMEQKNGGCGTTSF